MPVRRLLTGQQAFDALFALTWKNATLRVVVVLAVVTIVVVVRFRTPSANTTIFAAECFC